jgi:diketogulonate reductase-like aldo/keto reductase
VRTFCRERKIIYQGFSLLTANVESLHHPAIADIASRAAATPAQVIFAFARAVGMLPMTGTSNADHMTLDLDSRALTLSPDMVTTIEYLGTKGQEA